MIRRITLACAALTLAACDSGAPRDEVYDGPPPARFQQDTEATRVIFTGQAAQKCAGAGLKPVAETETNACALIGASRREIIIGNPCKATGKYAADLCHEIGHLNGWPKDHGR